MAYQKHELIDNQTLINAKLLGEMEDGIVGAYFTTDKTLTLSGGKLSVNTVDDMYDDTADNTLPITAAAVNVAIGNIEVLLKII